MRIFKKGTKVDFSNRREIDHSTFNPRVRVKLVYEVNDPSSITKDGQVVSVDEIDTGRMRQKINEHFSIPSGSTCQKAVPQPTHAHAAFNANQNGTLCLPLLSETQKIIWVYSNEINIQGDKVAKLDEAFSRFPYLTQKQTISLAQSCSLHPDQVKVWFMAQRLCYGISWDAKDINEVRRKMLGRITPKRKLEKRENETMKKPKLTREEESDAEEKVASNPREIKKETLRNAVAEGQMNAEKKRRGRIRKALKRKDEVHDHNETKTCQMPWPETGKAEVIFQPLTGCCSTPDITSLQIEGENSFAFPDEALDISPSVTLQSQVASAVTSLLVEKEQMETNQKYPKKKEFTQSPTESPTCSNLDQSVKKHRLICRPPLNARIKTEKQLAFMKMEFAKNQYPSAEQYREMSMLSGVSRSHLVQWFNDMRYSIKKAKPTWLSVEQHKRAVANVVCEQNIRKMKMQQNRETEKMFRSSQVERLDMPKSV